MVSERAGQIVRLFGVTIGAAIAGAPVGIGALLATGGISLSEYVVLTLFAVPIYFVLSLVFGWPLLLVLQRRGILTPRVLGGLGAGVGALGGCLMAGFEFEGSAIVLIGLGALSGFLPGAFLARFGIGEAGVRERQADRYQRQSNGARYRAFFSYSHADDRMANWLWSQLDGYVTPKDVTTGGGSSRPLARTLHPIFRDRVDMSAGGELSAHLGGALAASESLIVMCSPSSAQSRWVEYEVQTFINLGRRDRILPVIAAGEPNSQDPAQECFPPSLRGNEILAAELREYDSTGRRVSDGRQEGALKLIAALLGVDFDVLVRRERRRQQQRAAGYMAASGVMGALAILTGLFAFVTAQSFRWSLENTDRAVRDEFSYLAHVYEADGAAAVETYLRERTASKENAQLVCLVLLDEHGAVVAGREVGDRFPVPASIGAPQAFTSEIGRRNYFGSPFFVRSDGIVQRVSDTRVIGAASCDLTPPWLYGVFRAAFTDAPTIRVRTLAER